MDESFLVNGGAAVKTSGREETKLHMRRRELTTQPKQEQPAPLGTWDECRSRANHKLQIGLRLQVDLFFSHTGGLVWPETPRAVTRHPSPAFYMTQSECLLGVGR